MSLHRTIEIKPHNPGVARYALGPSRLYLDDIQLIHETLAKAANRRADSLGGEAAEVVITAGEAIADEPSDLRDANSEELARVRIALDSPLISINLKTRWADVSVQTSDSEGRDTAVGIRDYINKKRSIFVGLTNGNKMWDLSILIGSAVAASTLMTLKLSLWPIAVVGLVICSFATYGLNLLLSYFGGGAVRIYPYERAEVRRLSSETRKQLWIALAGAIIGALIVALAGLWAGVAVHH